MKTYTLIGSKCQISLMRVWEKNIYENTVRVLFNMFREQHRSLIGLNHQWKCHYARIHFLTKEAFNLKIILGEKYFCFCLKDEVKVLSFFFVSSFLLLSNINMI